MDLITVIAAGILAILGSGVTIVLGRKAGVGDVTDTIEKKLRALIGDLDREVADLKAEAIRAKEKSDAELAAAFAERDAKIRELEGCQGQLQTMKAEQRDSDAELLELYRQLGRRPPASLPSRVEAHRMEDAGS